ncbi:MAG TPA: hypothetical protein VK641_06620 [Terriglobales bacterium]|nr:hypothetical protein [Terriglobales bacterium]
MDQGWLDLEQIASIEVTSEDPSFPIESAFDSKDGTTAITREEQVENADDAVDAIIELNPLWDKAGLDLRSYGIKYLGQISVDELLRETRMSGEGLLITLRYGDPRPIRTTRVGQ